MLYFDNVEIHFWKSIKRLYYILTNFILVNFATMFVNLLF